MVGHKKLVREWFRLESLSAVPSHVLDSDEAAVEEEQEIEPAMTDDGVVGPLDDARKRAQSARDRAVWAEKFVFTADQIIGGRRVDGGLDVAAVEVIVWAGTKRREAQHVPEIRAKVYEMIIVEARIHIIGCRYYIVINIATW